MAPPCNRLPVSLFLSFSLFLSPLHVLSISYGSRALAPISEYTTYTLAKLQTLSTLIIIFIR